MLKLVMFALGIFLPPLYTSASLSCAFFVFPPTHPHARARAHTHIPDPLREGYHVLELSTFLSLANSIFLVQLVYKEESNQGEPNHIKIRIIDNHCAFLKVSPYLFFYLFVCFQGDIYQNKGSFLAGWMFALGNSSP